MESEFGKEIETKFTHGIAADGWFYLKFWKNDGILYCQWFAPDIEWEKEFDRITRERHYIVANDSEVKDG